MDDGHGISDTFPRSAPEPALPKTPRQDSQRFLPQQLHFPGSFHEDTRTTPKFHHLFPPTPGGTPQVEPFHPRFRDPSAYIPLGSPLPGPFQNFRTSETPPAHEMDRINPFMFGEHYGPVLEPLQVFVVGAELRINPLLQPACENTHQTYLKWNMLFPPSDCHRSIDPSDVSWMEGRHEPATFPRVTSLEIVSEDLPWMFKITAERPEVGVTCTDLINGISRSLNLPCSKIDYEALPPARQKLVIKAYKYNRSRAPDVPGGMLEKPLKRLDFLDDTKTLFGGIVNDKDYLNRINDAVLSCTLALMCLPRIPADTEMAQPQAEEVGSPVM